MTTAFVKRDRTKAEAGSPPDASVLARARTAGVALALSSFMFAVLQSVCVFFAALDGLRVGIGISSVVLAAGTAKAIDTFHLSWLRAPMMGFAVVGALLNLGVLWQVRRLRNRPAARWRQTLPGAGKVWMERVQLVLSVATLVLVGLEERQHLIWLRHW